MLRLDKTSVLEMGILRRRVVGSTLELKTRSWSEIADPDLSPFARRSSCHSPGKVAAVQEKRTALAPKAGHAREARRRRGRSISRPERILHHSHHISARSARSAMRWVQVMKRLWYGRNWICMSNSNSTGAMTSVTHAIVRSD